MNLWKTFKRINLIDYTPGHTKFMTKYIMPLMIIACGYGFWYIGGRLNSTLSEFTNIKTSIGEVELLKRSNNKPVETIYTDLYLTTIEGKRLYKKNVGKYFIELISRNLKIADEVEIFYNQRTGIIKELRKDGEVLISYQSELETHRKGRIVLGVFFVGFLIWYISRVYRYRKYGEISTLPNN